jgi:hypothetical protein
MFGIGYVEVLVGGVVLLLAVVAWRIGSRSAWVRVDDDTSVAVTAEALEAPFTRLLSGLPGSQLRMGGQATWTLVVHRPPWWTVIPACLLFPLGLLFLLFREEADLVVTIRATPDGSRIRAVGRTRRSVAETLGRAVAELPATRRPDPTGVPAP